MILFDKRELKILPWLTGAKFFLIGMVVLSVFVTSCDKSSIVGIDVQPTNDLLDVTVVDTATLITKTVKMDSLRTDENLLQLNTTDALLGTYVDPIFGRSSASIYTQLKLNTLPPDFGVNPIIYSAILSLVYDPSYYGKAEHIAQNVSVFQVLEDFEIENSYFSNTLLSMSPDDDLAGKYKFIPNLTENVVFLGDSIKPQLLIPLNNTFGQKILDNQSNVLNDNSFQNFIKGFYITTENTTNLNSEEGNILRIKLADPQTKLTLFYRNDSNSSLKYEFSLGNVARFSNFKHDFTTIDPNLASQLSVSPPSQNDVVFVQSMAGTKVKIEMPYIMEWNKSGTVSVNKAELVIKINTSATYKLDTFAAPEKLIVYGIKDDGSDFGLPDYDELRPNYFGGVYNATTQEYRINISRYIQQVLMGERKNNGLNLRVFNEAIHANRVVIGGGGNGSTYQMKLNITSTKVP